MDNNKGRYRSGEEHPYWGKSSPVKGKKWSLSLETRERMSIAQKGKKHPWVSARKGTKQPSNTGPLHPNWKGDRVSYRNLHRWVERNLGVPQRCEMCGATENRRFNWANKSREYKRDLGDWFRLCVPCHRKYDESDRIRKKQNV